MKYPIQIAPSILSADLMKLAEQVQLVAEAGANLIHVDVMDGHFVPNITFGPIVVSALKRITDLPLDVHLMISEPDRYITQFAKAGADIITVHPETCLHLHRSLQMIRDAGAYPGVSLNPATHLSTIEHVLHELYLVLIMSVNPGFGGQTFIPDMTKKINSLSQLRSESGFTFRIEVDGGINTDTAATVVSAGAEILVAGNAIFGQPDIREAFHQLKEAASRAID